MLLHLGETTYQDGRHHSPTNFYRTLRRSTHIPSTSAPTPSSYLDFFREAAEGADSILCLTVGNQFSASFDSAQTAARQAKDELPNVELEVMDSRSAAGAQGLIGLEAWRVANDGGGLAEVKAAAQDVMSRVRLLAFVDTLRYLWKGGRVPGIAHAGTSVLRIKPVFEMAEGKIKTVARPRTRQRAMERLLRLMRDRVDQGSLHATVMHADAYDSAVELRDQVERAFYCEELFVSEFSSVLGAHTGPGLVGVAFWSRPRS